MRSFLWKIYLSRFLDAANLIGVIFVLFFGHRGLNPFEISILISVWSLTTILTEVPFGVLADTFSRRNLLIIGLLLKAAGFVLVFGFIRNKFGIISILPFTGILILISLVFFFLIKPKQI